MKSATVAAMVAGGMAVAFVAFVVVLFLVKVLWAWTIPDLFPGAVQQGLVANSISWLTAIKIAIFAAVLSGFCRGAQVHMAKNEKRLEPGHPGDAGSPRP